MKKILFSLLAVIGIFTIVAWGNNAGSPKTQTATAAPNYDFVISTSAGCNGYLLTINDCGSGSYTPWTSTKNCSATNFFNGLVVNSGNPLLSGQPATFVNIGATYLIFNNNTTATRDVLSVTFHTGYNASHKPTISYNPSTRKFTIVNAGNPAYITVSKFSYTGLIQPGVTEFC